MVDPRDGLGQAWMRYRGRPPEELMRLAGTIERHNQINEQRRRAVRERHRHGVLGAAAARSGAPDRSRLETEEAEAKLAALCRRMFEACFPDPRERACIEDLLTNLQAHVGEPEAPRQTSSRSMVELMRKHGVDRVASADNARSFKARSMKKLADWLRENAPELLPLIEWIGRRRAEARGRPEREGERG